jgi:hypothetical protein
MVARFRVLFLSAVCGAVGLLAACSDNSTEPEPGPTTGSVTVTVATTGSDLDADGYMVMIGSTSQAVAASGSVTFADIAAGAVDLTLGGVAGNCAPTEANPQSATVVAGETAAVSFNVVCDAILGDFLLMAADRDGNVYTVDPVTGTESLSFTPMTDDGVGGMEPLGVISSMAWLESTDAWLFGLGGNSVCGNSGCIYVEDTVSGSATEGEWIEFAVTDLYGTPGLAPHPDGDRVFTFEADGSGELVSVDAAGVVDTLLSSLNERGSGKGTTFSSDTLLYVFGGDLLTEIDVEALTDREVGTFTLTGFPTLVDLTPTLGSMTTRPSDGVVFGILKDGGGGGSTTTTYLVTVNLETAEVTNVGVNTNLLDGVAFIPSRLVN